MKPNEAERTRVWLSETELVEVGLSETKWFQVRFYSPPKGPRLQGAFEHLLRCSHDLCTRNMHTVWSICRIQPERYRPYNPSEHSLNQKCLDSKVHNYGDVLRYTVTENMYCSWIDCYREYVPCSRFLDCRSLNVSRFKFQVPISTIIIPTSFKHSTVWIFQNVDVVTSQGLV